MNMDDQSYWDCWDLLSDIFWLVVRNIIFFVQIIGNFIIPTDGLIFFRRGGETTNQMNDVRE